MTAAAAAVLLVGALVVGYALLPHHAVAGNRLGRVAGEREPVGKVHVGADLAPRPGDLLICEVCRCGAYRPLGAHMWSSILCRNNH